LTKVNNSFVISSFLNAPGDGDDDFGDPALRGVRLGRVSGSGQESILRISISAKRFLEKITKFWGKIHPNTSGTDVMIFKIFSPKNLAKIFAFFAQNTVSFCKNCDHNIGF
jgi:hypothetical protein